MLDYSKLYALNGTLKIILENICHSMYIMDFQVIKKD